MFKLHPILILFRRKDGYFDFLHTTLMALNFVHQLLTSKKMSVNCLLASVPGIHGTQFKQPHFKNDSFNTHHD